MRPVLLELGGVPLQSYGLSKALAVLVAGWLLQRELRRQGRDESPAMLLAVGAAVGGFVGAKGYYLGEVAGDGIELHDLGGSGFTWYGGLIGGALTALAMARHHRIPVAALAGMAAIPLTVAYAIGRLGCLLAGDGTYGGPTDMPWGMSFPDGTVPTTDIVHPAPLYEAIAAAAIAVVLWRLRDRLTPTALFGLFAILSGLSRLGVEFVRLNDPVLLGLTSAQGFSLLLVALGGGLLVRGVAGRPSGLAPAV